MFKNEKLNQITDARGRKIVARPYERIVSLVPSLTDTVCTLGGLSRLVGRTIYCEEPKLLLHGVPTCGGTKNPDFEQILALEPDLIIASLEDNRAVHLDDLETLGLQVFTVMPHSLDDVDALLRDLGVLLDAGARAEDARTELRNARELAAGSVSTRGTVPTLAMIWREPWLAAGQKTFIDAMLRELGLANVMTARTGYPELDLDDLPGLAPALILLPDEPFRFSKRDAVILAEAAGIDPDRAVRLDGKQLGWYGTRTAASLRRLIVSLERNLPRPHTDGDVPVL
jgi:ABC-type Fe3+-hydroxamate transport system substrate-binding protein